MNIKKIAIQSPGDMGHGIGRLLVEGGYRVVSALEGRSERTKTLSQEAGIEDVGDIDNLFNNVDVILSIMRPDKAIEFIETLAKRPPSTPRDQLLWILMQSLQTRERMRPR